MLYRRLLDPHIWESPSFNGLSRDARLLFIGLISSSDDEGYFRADSASLKRGIFGFDDMTKDDVITLLREIQTKIKSIHFFKENDEAFGHFVNWERWQILRKDRSVASLHPRCQPCVNQLSTNCQPSVNQLSTKCQPSGDKLRQKIREDKISKDNKKEIYKEKRFLDNKDFHEELKKAFPNIPIEEEIKRMKDWLAANGKQKSDYAAFARNWLRAAKPKTPEGVLIL